MTTPINWQAELEQADQVHALRELLASLNQSISDLEESPYAEEEAVREQLHDLELLREYGERKLDRLLA